MRLDTLRLVGQRLKPLERRMRQVMRIGRTTKIEGSALDVQFSEAETLESVPYLQMNHLQTMPKVGDFILVLSPEGRLEGSVALAVVSMASATSENTTTIQGGEGTLGSVLKELAGAIKAMSSPGFFTSQAPVQPSRMIEISTKGFG